MLRIRRLQRWYSLVDSAMEEALSEKLAMRRFDGTELISDRTPHKTAILTFRPLLEKKKLGEQIYETVKAHPSARKMTMRKGTIVVATLIGEHSSNNSRQGTRSRNAPDQKGQSVL